MTVTAYSDNKDYVVGLIDYSGYVDQDVPGITLTVNTLIVDEVSEVIVVPVLATSNICSNWFAQFSLPAPGNQNKYVSALPKYNYGGYCTSALGSQTWESYLNYQRQTSVVYVCEEVWGNLLYPSETPYPEILGQANIQNEVFTTDRANLINADTLYFSSFGLYSGEVNIRIWYACSQIGAAPPVSYPFI